MFRVILKSNDKTKIIRADVESYSMAANVVYTTRMFNPASLQYSSGSSAIESYTVTLFLTNGTRIYATFVVAESLNEFMDKLLMAEEEQLTYNSISMDDLYQYAAEKILGGKHESFPGFKIPTIELIGNLYTEDQYIEERTRTERMKDEYDYKLHNTNVWSSGNGGI